MKRGLEHQFHKSQQQIDSQVFPGIQGGPLMHVIAAKAACFGEALKDDFKGHQEQIVANLQTMAARLTEHGSVWFQVAPTTTC